MSDFTTYMEGAIADAMFQGTSYTAPGTLYVALHTSDPGDSPDGTTEVSAGDYSRASVTAGSGWTKSGSAPTTTENASEISFGSATSDWGTVTHVSIWDGSGTGDNPMAEFALSSSKTINSGDEAKFNAGDLSFNVD